MSRKLTNEEISEKILKKHGITRQRVRNVLDKAYIRDNKPKWTKEDIQFFRSLGLHDLGSGNESR